MSQPIAILPPTYRSPGHFEGSYDFETEVAYDGRVESNGKGLTFGDFFDIINPLQHLPVVSTIYRAITGDEISAGARAVGALIYGGPVGLVSSGVTAAFEEASGGTIADHALALFEEIGGTDGDVGDVVDVSEATAGATPAPISTMVLSAPALATTSAAVLATKPVADLATPRIAASVQAGGIASAPQTSSAPFTVSRGRQSVGISHSLLAAQRAQVDLLLASLGDVGFVRGAVKATDEDGEGSATKPTQRGATPAWFPTAMQKALDKYQSSQGLAGSLAPRIP